MRTIHLVAAAALLALAGCGEGDDVAQQGLASGSAAESQSAAVSGEALYATHCSRCHSAGTDGIYPGTQQLALTRGEGQAVLLERDNLTADYVRQVVRHGIGAMATFRPTEITATELDTLAAYVAGGG